VQWLDDGDSEETLVGIQSSYKQRRIIAALKHWIVKNKYRNIHRTMVDDRAQLLHCLLRGMAQQ
jgi:hypothetical protein